MAMNYPKIGQTVEIHSYKHNSNIHCIWQETTILDVSNGVVIGANHKTLVMESDGRTWYTREPAVCYFFSEYWFNVLCMLRKDGVYFYCNLSSPFVYDQKTIKYIDYDLDIKVYPNLKYDILDVEEYRRHGEEMGYSSEVKEIINQQLLLLKEMIESKKGPFAPGFAEYWYDIYKKRLIKR